VIQSLLPVEASIPSCGGSNVRFRPYCATCASRMLYDDLLAEPLRQPLTYEACEKVIRAAGCISNNDAHRPRRIGLRASSTRHEWQRGSARGQLQKLSAGEVHFLTSLHKSPHYLVGEVEQPVRNLEAERLCSLEVDDEVEFDRLFHRQVGGVGALQNLMHVAGGLPEQVGQACAVGHQSPRTHVLAQLIHCRQPVLRHEVHDPCDTELVDWF